MKEYTFYWMGEKMGTAEVLKGSSPLDAFKRGGYSIKEHGKFVDFYLNGKNHGVTWKKREQEWNFPSFI